jgi:hypothetical protein
MITKISSNLLTSIFHTNACLNAFCLTNCIANSLFHNNCELVWTRLDNESRQSKKSGKKCIIFLAIGWLVAPSYFFLSRNLDLRTYFIAIIIKFNLMSGCHEWNCTEYSIPLKSRHLTFAKCSQLSSTLFFCWLWIVF